MPEYLGNKQLLENSILRNHLKQVIRGDNSFKRNAISNIHTLNKDQKIEKED